MKPVEDERRVVAANPLLAIDDGRVDGQYLEDKNASAQGEPDLEVSAIVPDAPLTGTRVDQSKSRTWGPFQFRWVWRVISRGPRKGLVTTQWECRCPFHSDEHAGEMCRKTKQFEGEEGCEQQFLWLKWWCLAGRWCPVRTADDGSGHLEIDMRTVALIPVSRMDTELQHGLEADSWILARDDVDPADAMEDAPDDAAAASESGDEDSGSSCMPSSGSD